MKFLNVLISLAIVAILMAIIDMSWAPKPPGMLIMFHNESCRYCQKFMEEVCLRDTILTPEGGSKRPRETYSCWPYDLTEYSEKYPILIVTRETTPKWIDKSIENGYMEIVRFTPTFVLWNGEREIGRIVGFETEEAFYKELEKLIKKDRPRKHFYRVGKRDATPIN